MKHTRIMKFRYASLAVALLLVVPVVTSALDYGVELNSSTSVDVKTNTLDVTLDSSMEVSSDADLKVFSENIVVKNNNVVEVDVGSSSDDDKDSQVVIVYKHRAKLFGFIPVTIRSKTEVMAEAQTNDVVVKSNLSWWSLFVTVENYNKAELESKIKNNAVVKANAKVDASASAKAQVVEAVIAEIEANSSTQVTINN